MPSLNPIPANANLGPIYVKQDREQYPPELGETCSLTDRIYQDKTSHQKLNFQLHPWQDPTERLTDYLRSNPRSVQVLPAKQVVVEEYREMIREHVERRLLFFFQQLIVCHQTKLHFESVGAQDQGRSADAIFMKVGGLEKKYDQRQAAHSSGNPCIVAYDNTQWERYQAGEGPKPDGFVFLKDTDYYRTVNATMNMPKWINDADREIDEKSTNSKLRDKGSDIINRNSQGLILPDQGIVKYIEEALAEVSAAKERLEKANKDPEVRAVLAYYKEDLLELQQIIKTDPTFLENFLNLKMGNATQDERSKRIILKMRYAAIRNCQVNQSKLIQKVEKLSKEILGELKAANGNRKPDHFDAAFKATIVEHARTDEDRKRLEKLLNFSSYNFEAQLQGRTKTIFSNTKHSVNADTRKDRIQFVVRDILNDMRSLRTQEMYERAQTVKELRGMKRWTQKKLGQEIKQIFPNAAASQSTISRIENRGKLVTQPIAAEFSHVFGVDSGLFMPHFYYE